MHVKPGDTVYWERTPEIASTDLADMLDDMTDGDEVTIYRATLIEPMRVRKVNGRLINLD